MKFSPSIIIVLVAILLSPTEPTLAQTTDEEAIRAILTEYVEAWRDGDSTRLRDVLAAEGSVTWVSGSSGQETLQSMTFAEVLKRRRPQPAYGLEWEVLSLDVVDRTVAVAKLHISRAGGSYVDFLSLYKIGKRWRIVNKTYAVRSN